jgi:hypothetical protein
LTTGWPRPRSGADRGPRAVCRSTKDEACRARRPPHARRPEPGETGRALRRAALTARGSRRRPRRLSKRQWWFAWGGMIARIDAQRNAELEMKKGTDPKSVPWVGR